MSSKKSDTLDSLTSCTGTAIRQVPSGLQKKILSILDTWPGMQGMCKDTHSQALKKSIHQLAKAWGGEWLNPDYTDLQKLKMRCAQGHTWTTPSGLLSQGHWCKKCYPAPSRNNIEAMRELARERGGECLSQTYVSNQDKLTWLCENGHVWQSTPASMKSGSWCLVCHRDSRRWTIEDMQALAKQHQGYCLSTDYQNQHGKLTWQCKEGHVWEAKPSTIKRGCWCPTCSVEKRRLGIEAMHELAHQHQGKCLSTTYVDAHHKLAWQCKNGHTWEAAPNNVYQGQWCNLCRIEQHQKKRLKAMQALARQRGGKCLSKQYVSTNRKLTWQCSKGHVWQSTPTQVEGCHAWCTTCKNENQKLTLAHMQALATQRGGQCLSTEYIDVRHKMRWQCAEGHLWETTAAIVNNGSWCPNCATGKLTLADMQNVAHSRGGRCVSTEYINSRTKMLWECMRGHQWNATPNAVIYSESWCPQCYFLGKCKLEKSKRKYQTVGRLRGLAGDPSPSTVASSRVRKKTG